MARSITVTSGMLADFTVRCESGCFDPRLPEGQVPLNIAARLATDHAIETGHDVSITQEVDR